MEKNFRKIEAVIFDLDGTLVDSEPVYFEADKKIFKKYGIDLDFNSRKKYIGTDISNMMAGMKTLYNLDETLDELVSQRTACYLELAHNCTSVFPEMQKFVELLNGAGYPMAIASGSSPEIIDVVLEVSGLRKYFDVVISSSRVKHGKPAPDIFLEASRMLGFVPEKCLVIEDSRYGVDAAKSARMSCLAVPFLLDEPLNPSFYTADLLFENGMADFTAEKAFAWLNHG